MHNSAATPPPAASSDPEQSPELPSVCYRPPLTPPTNASGARRRRLLGRSGGVDQRLTYTDK
eukprot:10165277-Alexandrium_andersonii.AAC.1